MIVKAQFCSFAFSVLLFCLVIVTASAQSRQYDKQLADSLGADDYGMKKYVLVILKTGSAVVSKQKSDSLFLDHLHNIAHLAKIGKLAVAGPLKKNISNFEGIFILNAKTVEEAKLLLETDAAIKAKLLDPELFEWYGSAALPMYLKYHDSIKKKNF